MTISEMKDYFLIIQDKYGSPYFTDSEFETFINRATIDEVISLLPIDGGTLNVELNQNTRMRIAPLLFTTAAFTMDAFGKVDKAGIELYINNPVLRILAIGWDDQKPVKDTRRNQWYSFKDNTFKTPTVTAPRCYEEANQWKFSPIDQAHEIVFHGIRYPELVSLSGPDNSEMPDFMHNEIIARALEIAGVGSRDQMLSELKKLNNV